MTSLNKRSSCTTFDKRSALKIAQRIVALCSVSKQYNAAQRRDSVNYVYNNLVGIP